MDTTTEMQVFPAVTAVVVIPPFQAASIFHALHIARASVLQVAGFFCRNFRNISASRVLSADESSVELVRRAEQAASAMQQLTAVPDRNRTRFLGIISLGAKLRE